MSVQFPAKPTPIKSVIKARINEYNKAITESKIEAEKKAKAERQLNKINESILRNKEKQMSRYAKYTAFTEQTRDLLMEHMLFNLCSTALKKVDKARHTTLMESHDNTTALHSMIFKFIHENGGAASLLAKMRISGRTMYIDETRNILESTFKTIIESVDKDDPDSFRIDSSITDKFKDEISSEDTDIMADEISNRIISAIGDFVEGNIKDKDDIVAALNQTKDKIDSIEDDREDLKESYARLGKKFITNVRARKHGLFNEMVQMLCQEVVQDKSLRESYMNGAHVNVGKVVEKTTLMYAFLETVNTMRLIKITPEYIKKNVLSLD